MAPTPPVRTDAQKAEALAKARHTREVWAELKRQVAAGELALPDVFARADRDDTVANIKVLKVLESLPNIGKIRSRRLLDDLGISESRRLRGVGERQRKRLIERLA